MAVPTKYNYQLLPFAGPYTAIVRPVRKNVLGSGAGTEPVLPGVNPGLDPPTGTETPVVVPYGQIHPNPRALAVTPNKPTP